MKKERLKYIIRETIKELMGKKQMLNEKNQCFVLKQQDDGVTYKCELFNFGGPFGGGYNYGGKPGQCATIGGFSSHFACELHYGLIGKVVKDKGQGQAFGEHPDCKCCGTQSQGGSYGGIGSGQNYVCQDPDGNIINYINTSLACNMPNQWVPAPGSMSGPGCPPSNQNSPYYTVTDFCNSGHCKDVKGIGGGGHTVTNMGLGPGE